MQSNESTNEFCLVLNNMNFKSLCIENRFLEGGITKSGFLLAFVFSLLNSLTSDRHRSPPTYHVRYSQQVRENLCCFAGYRAGLRSGRDISLQIRIGPCEGNWGQTPLWDSCPSWGCHPADRTRPNREGCPGRAVERWRPMICAISGAGTDGSRLG